MPLLTTDDGVKLHYEETGSGTPLVFVHEFAGDARSWEAQVRHFARRYRCVVYNARGYPPSEVLADVERYSQARARDDIRAVLDALGIKKAHYLGHSTGGAIGQALAIDHPDRIDGLVLSATWAKSDAYFKRLFAARKRALQDSGPEAYMKASNLALLPPWFIAERSADVEAMEALALKSFGLPEIWESRIDAISVHDRLAGIGKIRHRTLVVVAEDDMVTPLYFSKQLAEKVPKATLKTLKTGGHMCMLTVPEDYNRVVLDWLTAIEHL